MDLEKLRMIWIELKIARQCASQAQRYKTDHALVYGAAGFALEHLEKAMKLVEELGRDEKRKRIRRHAGRGTFGTKFQ